MKKLSDNLSKRDVDSLVKGGFVSVYEKMDMIYFKVSITGPRDFEIRSKKGNPYTEVDYVCNSFIFDVKKFVDALPIDKLFECFGDVIIGFFYHPKRAKRVIEYENIPDNTFIISDYYTKDVMKRDDYLLMEILSPFCPYNMDIGTYMFNMKFHKADDVNPEFVKETVLKKGRTFSGNGVDNIGGVILRTIEGKSFSVIFTPSPEVGDKTSKLLYRDMVVADFLSVMSERFFTIKGDTYLDHMSQAFIEYVNTTDLFTKMYIESDDLIPPFNGNIIGPISLELLDSVTSSICRSNPLYANVFRILIVAFNPHRKSFDVSKRDMFNPELVKMIITFLSNKY